MKIISKISFSLSFPIILFALVFGACKNTKKEPITINNFSAADEIIKSIQILTFPDTNFNIMDFGAIADGETNNSEAIKKAIEACFNAGGGKVIIPSGTFLTGPIYLKSNVNLHLEEGSIVLFSTNKEDIYYEERYSKVV